MVITLYQNNSKRNCVNKTLTEKYTYTNCQMVGEWNEEFPVIKLAKSLDLSNCNYCKLNDKYYFMNTPTEFRNGFYIIPLEYDYLENEKSDFLNWRCFMRRGSIGENYIENPVDVFSVKKDIDYLKMGEGFKETEEYGSYVLVTAQKGYTPV